MSYKFQIIITLIIYLVILDYCICAEFVESLESIINGGYNEDEFNPLFVEELNEIKNNPEQKKDNFYIRLRSGQWFALKQQVEYDSSEMGLKRVYGVLPVNPFAGNIFTPSLSELELADKYCEALLDMRNKGISTKIGLKIAKDGLIREKFCSDAAELYFNGLRPRPATLAQKQNEIESLGNIEYFDYANLGTITSQIDIPRISTGARARYGGKYASVSSSQEAELITKQTLLRNFLHVVKQLHLNTLRKDPLRLREYFPGTLLQLRDAIESDDPEVVAVKLLRLGPTSDLLEQFINNHRGRRDILLIKTKKGYKKKRNAIFEEWMDLISNTDLSVVTLPNLEYLAYKHVALTPSIMTQIKKLYDLIVKEKEKKQNYYTPQIIETLDLLPDIVRAEIRIFFELNTKYGYYRINTLEKIRSMIGVIQPLVKTVNHFSEEEFNKVLANTGLSQNEMNYFSRNLSKILLTIMERRRLKIKENDDDDDLLNNEPSISVNSLIEMIQKMNNSSLGAIMDHIESIVPNFTNKNMHSEATEQQKKEIEAFVKLPTSPVVSRQLYGESVLRPLLSDAIPNEYGTLDKFIKGFYILMAETGVRLQIYLRNGFEGQVPNKYENYYKQNVFLEDNLRHNSELWQASMKSLLEETLFPYELATRRLLQYLKECKIGVKFGSNEEELKKRSSEIDQSYLQTLLDNFESIKLTEKRLNPIFIGEKGNMLILPNRRHHLINYIFQKDGASLYRILKDEKLHQILVGLVDLLEEIQIPKKEDVNIQGPYWDREKNEWVNADKMRKNEVEIIYEPQKVTDLPINREQEWERIALFSKWSDFVKGIPINSIPNGFKFSFGLYSNFIHFCQRGIRELAYRLIVRDKPTNTEPEGKYWEYLPRNKFSILINADNSKAREEKVLSFCSAVYISIYSEKGVPEEYKGSLPNVWSKETDKYEKEAFITPKDKSKQLRYHLDDVNEQWSFIASEARKPGIFMAPTMPTDSSLLGDVWRKLYVDQHIATSSVNEVDAKISILTDMCSKAIRNLMQKKNYYGEQLYKMVYDGENSIEVFCHDVSRRWFSKWPSDISNEMLLSSQHEHENQSFKPFDRSYLKSKKPAERKIREGFSKTNKKISPVVMEEFNFNKISRNARSFEEIPTELCDESINESCHHKNTGSYLIRSTSSINLASGSMLLNSDKVKRVNSKVRSTGIERTKNPEVLSRNKIMNIRDILDSSDSGSKGHKELVRAIPTKKINDSGIKKKPTKNTKIDKTFSELID
ncbi:Uncharacterized protein GY17_00003106 [Cryptosporidium hominis]|uniref:Uncharacterized protein n=1 Tax=Cryptosporidium hominis TaxID=237895 RepID=A0ABX5BAX0_CRYHO|nr:Uncharacterized protein GY17_00003106 [Cryptosporidium hominis]|eukprot:PPS93947.1 Uncharacterized protein GY17_00003106 [Cryptosporidium hominis]